MWQYNQDDFLKKHFYKKMINQSLLYEDLKTYLLLHKSCETNSPKNRNKLYSFLQKEGLTYTTEIIGYTNGNKTMNRWTQPSIGWDYGRVAKWINSKRILPEDLKACCNENFIFEDIAAIFDEHMPNKQRIMLLKDKWGEKLEWTKYTPFDNCRLRKTIVRITIN